MKRLFVLVILLPSFIFAQYWGERTTEQSFEKSNLHFSSQFLNTFGVKYYKNIAPGMIEDPFLNIEINPALIPDIGEKEIYIYLDFRGDRTEPEIVETYYQPTLDVLSASSYIPPIDRRWFSDTRTEPEPLVSLGVITFPLEKSVKDLYVGGTYQLILKEESYYSMPYWIYNSRYYYDSFGNETKRSGGYDIITRYSGSDEMVNEAHLYSLFTGFKVNEKLNLGVSLNGVSHSRKGNFSNYYYDSFYYPDNSWNNSDYTQRSQEYGNIDLNFGATYQLSPLTNAGVKVGVLDGAVDQSYISKYSYDSQYGEPFESEDWSISYSDYSTDQIWKHDGNVYYFRLHLSRQLSEGNEAFGYYKYSYSDIETSTRSVISDTSNHSSSWDGTTYYSISSLSDIRRGQGSRNNYSHEGMLNFKWKLSEASNLIAGVYFNSSKSKIGTIEPVKVSRYSMYNSGEIQSSYEDKKLEWQNETVEWTLQIPLLYNVELGKHISMLLGINRIFESWEITDVTTAYIKERREKTGSEERIRTNFGERYFQPDRGITEDHTDLVTQIEARPSESLKINLLLDPEFEDTFRIAQWWLSFRASL
jgi:hypothetical protein